jgi:TonB family protein
MIIIEFLIFVVSSGLFCSERFRGHLWAVLVAGVIATGSSLLFMWDFGVKMAGHTKEPPVITRIVKETVEKPVLRSQPASTPKDKPHVCGVEFYPADSVIKGEEGNTKLAFKILTDGTVESIKVVTSSGSQRLDEAAVKCVGNWHYRPAIKDGALAEVDSGASVKWVLPKATDAKPDAAAKPEEKKEDKKLEEPATAADASGDAKGHHWYDPLGWFATETDKSKQQTPQP